jgi:DNA-3-methyladenine glycosylase II
VSDNPSQDGGQSIASGWKDAVIMLAQCTRNEASLERRCVPDGPFDLATQNRYFGGWVTSADDPDEIVMAFPVEGWQGSVAVRLRQDRTGVVVGRVAGVGGADLDAGWRQALAVLSLDADGSGYPDVGRRDDVVGALQEEHRYLRPVLFHSPYEAACHFVLAHRISAAQGRRIRQRMAEQHGDQLSLDGSTVSAFPTPQQLLTVSSVPGVAVEKIERLHVLARAALDGLLDRARLRDLPMAEATAQLRRLPGIGPFFSSAIVLRGAGLVDALPPDEITLAGVGRLYGLGRPATPQELEAIGESWRPYRMWCSVLVHVSERRSRAERAVTSPRRSRSARKD